MAGRCAVGNHNAGPDRQCGQSHCVQCSPVSPLPYETLIMQKAGLGTGYIYAS